MSLQPPARTRRVDLVRSRAELPVDVRAALDAYERHLASERGLSPHTVRAYLGDVVGLLVHVAGDNPADATVESIDLAALRSWLAAQLAAGASRTTMARRAAAARTFTAWATRAGLLAEDPGPRLSAPRPHRTLPAVLRQDQAEAAMSVADFAAENGDPVALRDQAVVELLYATGVRVAELCGLDLDDVDYSQRVIRVLGKGSRERTVPFGVPAERAVRRWVEQGRSALVSTGTPTALFLGVKGRRLDARTARRVVRDVVGAVPGTAPSGPHGLRHSAATHLLEGGAD